MGRMRLLCESDGNTVEGFCIVKAVQTKINVKGSAYLDLVLADREGEVDAKLWDYSAGQHGVYESEQVVKIRASVVIWKEVEQLKIDRIRAVSDEDDVDMSMLVPCAPFDPEWMYQELYSTAEEFADEDLKRLTQYILRTNKEELIKAPAGIKLHHAYRSGLLHHTFTMLLAAKAICPIYPALDAQLVYAGVILHDIAKIEELSIGKLGLAGAYSKKGQLVGHINMGVSAIRSTCELLDIPEEISYLIQHMILAHHGVPEFGSPRYPMFPEAELLSELDMLDSRLFEMFDALEGIQKGGFTERIWALENRQLYKHGHLE